MKDNALRAPLQLHYSGRTLPNRLVKAATTEQIADPLNNQPNDAMCGASECFAKGGVGLYITGNVHIDRRYMEATRNVAAEKRDLEDPEVMKKWKKWAIASKGGVSGETLSIVQISHGGRQVPRSVNWWSSLAPSEVSLELSGIPKSSFSLFAPPRAATIDDINDIIERFLTAAKVCYEAGFDGVQVHSAHGYLLSTFLSPRANIRTDQYGGNPENRSRLLCEICRRIRETFPKSFILSVKLNTADFQKGGLTEEESLEVSKALARIGVDLLEYSGGTYECAAMMGKDQKAIDELLVKNNAGAQLKQSTRVREAFFIDYVDKAREVLKNEAPMALLLTGGWRSGKAMHTAVAKGTVDLIGLARPLCVEPTFAKRLLDAESYETDNTFDVKALSYEITKPYSFLPKPLQESLSQQLQANWHIAQIHRFGRGLTSPDLHLPFGPFLLETLRHLLFDPAKHPNIVFSAQIGFIVLFSVFMSIILKN